MRECFLAVWWRGRNCGEAWSERESDAYGREMRLMLNDTHPLMIITATNAATKKTTNNTRNYNKLPTTPIITITEPLPPPITRPPRGSKRPLTAL